MKERCRHERNSRIILGGRAEWCFVCGVFRRLKPIGISTVSADSRWFKPSGNPNKTTQNSKFTFKTKGNNLMKQSHKVFWIVLALSYFVLMLTTIIPAVIVKDWIQLFLILFILMFVALSLYVSFKSEELSGEYENSYPINGWNAMIGKHDE